MHAFCRAYPEIGADDDPAQKGRHARIRGPGVVCREAIRAALLKAAKTAQGAGQEAGIRIQRAAMPDERNALAVGFVVRDQPQSGNDAFERITLPDAALLTGGRRSLGLAPVP